MKDEMKGWKAEIEIDEARTVSFPQGMVGFSDAIEYVVLNSGSGDIVCFQSTTRPEASFLMTPWDEARLGNPPSLSPDQKATLNYSEAHNILWMLVLNPFADQEWVLANRKAPVALNLDTGLGMQCIQADPKLELRFKWMQQPAKAEKKAA